MISESEARERTLIRQAQQGDTCAMEALIMAHQPLLHALSRRVICDAAVKEELVQAGNLGLIRAMQHYDGSQGVKLITYAVPWILGEMRRALRREQSACLSLEQPNVETQTSLSDVLPGDDGVDVEHLDLRLALGQLNEQERLLICLRYFRDKTQKETALLLHKSQAQISRMERRALDLLHAYLA